MLKMITELLHIKNSIFFNLEANIKNIDKHMMNKIQIIKIIQ